MNKYLKNIFIAFISFFLLIAIFLLGILWNYSNSIPDYKFLKSYKPPVSSKVYSGNGDLVADFSTEKRILYHIAQYLKMSLIHFYQPKIKIFFHIQELMLKEF